MDSGRRRGGQSGTDEPCKRAALLSCEGKGKKLWWGMVGRVMNDRLRDKGGNYGPNIDDSARSSLFSKLKHLLILFFSSL